MLEFIWDRNNEVGGLFGQSVKHVLSIFSQFGFRLLSLFFFI